MDSAVEPFVWFSDSDTQVLGDRICSKCHQDIPEDDVPLMLFRGEGAQCEIARFHWEPCAMELFRTGALRIEPIGQATLPS